MARFEFKSWTLRWFHYPYLVRVEILVYFSRGVQVAGAAWRVETRIMVGVGDLVERTEDGHIGQVFGGWTVERSDDVVCGLYRAQRDEEYGFLG
jgi:hypothetical protein